MNPLEEKGGNMISIDQGGIYKVEGLKGLYLVASKDFFNRNDQAILCPLVKESFDDPLHIIVHTPESDGIVLCEQIKMIDLRYRGFSKVSQLEISDVMNITDAIQSIFDY